jgi:hypothetical protein
MGYVLLAMDRRTRRRARRREVATLIRTLRLRAGLTQEGLAYRMTQLGEPTNRSQVSMWELLPPRDPGEADPGQMPATEKFIVILQATEPEDRPETPEERQARVLRGRLTDLRRTRPPE